MAAAGLQERLSMWPGVRTIRDSERGTRFCTKRGEFLHFHGEKQMDVRLPAAERDAALARGVARFHPRAHEGGWVIVDLVSDGFSGSRSDAVSSALRLAAAAYRWSLRVEGGRKPVRVEGAK